MENSDVVITDDLYALGWTRGYQNGELPVYLSGEQKEAFLKGYYTGQDARKAKPDEVHLP